MILRTYSDRSAAASVTTSSAPSGTTMVTSAAITIPGSQTGPAATATKIRIHRALLRICMEVSLTRLAPVFPDIVTALLRSFINYARCESFPASKEDARGPRTEKPCNETAKTG